MTVRDRLSYSLSSLDYRLGTLKAKILVGAIGNNNNIHRSVNFLSPSRIAVGSNCEIRQGAFLDARSGARVAITIGDNTRIKDYVGISAYGGAVELGENVLLGRCSTIFGHGGVIVGSHTMIGPYVAVISTNHLTYLVPQPFQEQGFTREKIEIGSNVWIGCGVSVLAGSTIESNVVVAAGAVVQGRLEEGWLYGGVPVKAIKRLEREGAFQDIAYKRDWSLLK